MQSHPGINRCLVGYRLVECPFRTYFLVLRVSKSWWWPMSAAATCYTVLTHTHKKQWLQVDLELEPLGDATATAPRFVSFKCFSTFLCFDRLSVVRKNVQLFTIVQVIDDAVSEVLEYFVNMEVHELGIRQNRQELYQSVLLAAEKVIARLLGVDQIEVYQLPSQALFELHCCAWRKRQVAIKALVSRLILIGLHSKDILHHFQKKTMTHLEAWYCWFKKPVKHKKDMRLHKNAGSLQLLNMEVSHQNAIIFLLPRHVTLLDWTRKVWQTTPEDEAKSASAWWSRDVWVVFVFVSITLDMQRHYFWLLIGLYARSSQILLFLGTPAQSKGPCVCKGRIGEADSTPIRRRPLSTSPPWQHLTVRVEKDHELTTFAGRPWIKSLYCMVTFLKARGLLIYHGGKTRPRIAWCHCCPRLLTKNAILYIPGSQFFMTPPNGHGSPMYQNKDDKKHGWIHSSPPSIRPPSRLLLRVWMVGPSWSFDAWFCVSSQS